MGRPAPKGPALPQLWSGQWIAHAASPTTSRVTRKAATAAAAVARAADSAARTVGVAPSRGVATGSVGVKEEVQFFAQLRRITTTIEALDQAGVLNESELEQLQEGLERLFQNSKTLQERQQSL